MKKIILLFLTILSISCSNESPDQHDILDLNTQNVDQFKLSDIATNINYYPFETSDSSLFGFNSAIMSAFTEDKFYIINKPADIFKIFSPHGKYLGEWCAKGNGPNEYSFAMGITINPLNEDILIKSPKSLKLYDKNYNYKNTIYPDSIIQNKKYTLGRASARKDGNWVITAGYVDNNKIDCIIFNSKGDVVFRYEENEAKIEEEPMKSAPEGTFSFRIMPTGACYPYEDDIRILSEFNDTIFNITKNNNINIGYILKRDNPQIKILLSSVIENNESIFLNSIFGENGIINYVYNKNNQQISRISKEMKGLINNIDNGAPFYPSFNIGNNLYQIISATEFIEMSEKYNSAKMKEVASILTEDSNPVLIEITNN